MKDRFSEQAEGYQKYRPTYPEALYSFLLNIISKKDTAWDCGTGNGQVATELSKYFNQVYASDISENQLQQAPYRSNITYKVERAEYTSFPDYFFDLITVAQAIHWFDFDAFYKEAKRILKPDGFLVIMGYGLIRTDDAINSIIDHFYKDIIGSYWDKERKYIDESYQTIPFPLEELKAPAFYHEMDWNLEQLTGYLNTWSAVKLYQRKEHLNPISKIENELKEKWGPVNNTKKISFPILLRIGKLTK